MKFIQKTIGIRTEFEIKEEGVQFLITDRSGNRSVFVPYPTIDFRQPMEVQKPIAQLVMAIGVSALIGIILLIASLTQQDPTLRAAGYIFLGLAAALKFGSRFKKTNYTIFKGSVHNLLILKDENYSAILKELQQRWKNRMRQLFTHIDIKNASDKELKKFEWLRNCELISAEEFSEAAKQLQKAHGEQTGSL
jgi:hypothetical protein